MSSKHTPGPWVAGRPDMKTIVDGVGSKWIYGPKMGSGCGYIAVASGLASANWDVVMANAYLIAAAPDLLEACEEVLDKLDYLRSFWGDEAIASTVADKLREAVNKAMGGADE